MSTTPSSAPCKPAVSSAAEPLDLAEWVLPHSKIGRTKMYGGEFFMASRNPGYYYVIAGVFGQKSVGARSIVTVRNINGAATRLGYGLVFHSDTTPLIQGYAFLIDTANRRFRVVHHTPKKEKVIVHWTHSPYIAPGRGSNTLEVLDRGSATDLYINCHRVATVSNQYAFKDGVIGLYVGSTIRMAFHDLIIESVPKASQVY